jgi:dihydrofolate reductase
MGEPSWTFQFPRTEDQMKFKLDELFDSDALLLGRVTYQGFAAAWPRQQGDPDGYGKRMNSLPKFVVSNTLDKVEWNNSSLVRGGFVEGIVKIKEQPGRDLLVFGSLQVAKGLIEHGLADELRLMIYPIFLGNGKRFLAETAKSNMKLIEAKAFASGVALLRYQFNP